MPRRLPAAAAAAAAARLQGSLSFTLKLPWRHFISRHGCDGRLSPRNFVIYISPGLGRLFSPAPDPLPPRRRLRLDPPPPADGAPMSTIRHRSSLSSLTRSGGGPSSPTKHRRCRSTRTTARAPPPPPPQHQHPDGSTDTRKGRYVSGDGSDVSSYALPTLPLLFPPKSKSTMRFRRRGRWWRRCCC